VWTWSSIITSSASCRASVWVCRPCAVSGLTGRFFVDVKHIVTRFKIFIYNAFEGKPIEIWGDCRKLGRDLAYVKDAVACFIGAIDSKTAHGQYNVGTGVRTTPEEVKAVVKVFRPQGPQSQLIYRPDKPNYIHSYPYDVSKAKRDLGCQVKYPLMALVEDYC
jgi:UDP-glucose 4-epimerase